MLLTHGYDAKMRVAAIDLGTNSTRMLVADVESESVGEVVRRLEITRLGEGVDARRRLLPLPMARVRNCLVGYRRELEGLGAERTLAVGTSAIRDAENGEAFLGELEWSYGFSTRLLTGEEEARLTFRGANGARDGHPATLVVDIGGGSTELVTKTSYVSLDVGCVRMTERFLASDPPGRAELDRLGQLVRSLLTERVPEELGAEAGGAVGVAGTVTTLAALDLGLEQYEPERTHGHRIRAASVDEQLARLAALPVAERLRVPGLEPARAPVIVAGVAILRELLAHFGLDAIEASERDLLHGVALEAAALPEPVEGDAPPGAYTCC